MSAQAINTLRDSFRELVQFIGGGCIYAPGEVARVSGEKFVWLWLEQECWRMLHLHTQAIVLEVGELKRSNKK